MNIFYWHNKKFFYIYFPVVFPRDHTTDFAFVIEHLLVKALWTFSALIRSHTICPYPLGLHIPLVDSHCKPRHVWSTFIISSRPYSKLCYLCRAMGYKNLLESTWIFEIQRECKVPENHWPLDSLKWIYAWRFSRLKALKRCAECKLYKVLLPLLQRTWW